MEIKLKIFSLFMWILAVRLPLFLTSRHRFIFRRYFSRCVRLLIKPKRLIVDRIISGYGKGIKLAVYVGDGADILEMDCWLGYYESHVQGAFAEFIKDGFVVYDIGAYIGFYSLLAAGLSSPSGKVYAFEPYPQNVERLKLHISLNQMQERVFCIPKAVTDRTGLATCRYLGQEELSRFINVPYASEEGSRGRLSFETVSLDDFVFRQGNPAPNLVKIDVEGEEDKVISGAQRLLNEFRPQVICELHYRESALKVFEQFASLGYSIRDIHTHKLAVASDYDYGHIIAWHKERL